MPENNTPLLNQIILEGRMAEEDNEDQMKNAKATISSFVQDLMEDQVNISLTKEKMIKQRIEEINQLLQKQLNPIIHHPDFQKLEASWRGLHYLVMQSETSESLKIRFFNAKKDDMKDDLNKASEFDQSSLFKKVYTNEYGQYGGIPFGVLIGDYEFRNHPQDIDMLKKLSEVAAASHTPFISAASPKLFDWDSFSELNKPRDLSKIFEGDDYAKWRSFRNSEESRYVVLTLPHILMRMPYGEDTDPIKLFPFEENVSGDDSSKYLWGNAAYALGTRITDAFAKYGWCAAIRGPEGGGLVEGLPVHLFETEEEGKQMKCPTEVLIPDRRENEFSKLGFAPLLHCRGTDYAAFFSVQTTRKEQVFNKPEANASERLSAQLQYMFSACRIAHYVKCMMRDKIGAMMDEDDISDYLNEWIIQYVTDSPGDGQSIKARKPFKAARIDVVPIKGKPGCYESNIFLRPHYMLDSFNADISLVAELPPPLANKG